MVTVRKSSHLITVSLIEENEYFGKKENVPRASSQRCGLMMIDTIAWSFG